MTVCVCVYICEVGKLTAMCSSKTISARLKLDLLHYIHRHHVECHLSECYPFRFDTMYACVFGTSDLDTPIYS